MNDKLTGVSRGSIEQTNRYIQVTDILSGDHNVHTKTDTNGILSDNICRGSGLVLKVGNKVCEQSEKKTNFYAYSCFTEGYKKIGCYFIQMPVLAF
jgi:hypothetical protein